MRRKPPKADMGEAISFDLVLTVLTVLMVLRMIFLIPMVNVDKAKLDQARQDSLWIRIAHRLERAPDARDSLSHPYLAAFGVEGCRIATTSMSDGSFVLSALSPDSTLVLVEHQASSGRFSSLRVQRSSAHPVFRRGLLVWSPSERSWFATSDTTDYGQDPSSVAFLARVRSFEETR